MTAYLDASAVVKLYLDDEGDAFDLRPIVDGFDSVTTSRLTYIETHAALAAARRTGRISAARHAAALDDLAIMWATFNIIDLSQDVAHDAGEVAETFDLRAGDAVQLASLRALAVASVPLVAWDVRLRRAAIANGFACYPAEI
ncbi:MAG: type II toxin-antitoxin system VapC family toxin [Chloroflexi bacterium]|nr:type II toxin-antitoxin system VapC family toxin [Chloroflexota bacterium]